MADENQARTFSRRNVLKVLAGAAAAGGSIRLVGAAEAPHCAAPVAPAISSLAAATESAPQFFTADQIRTLTALSEAIIPADGHSPGAAAAGVPAFIDATLFKAPAGQKQKWTEGLAAIDRWAERDFGARFAECTASQQDQLLLAISANEVNPATQEERFFVIAKQSTIEGYYNSEIGLHKDLEYQGNTALAEFEGCTHPEHGAPPAVKS